MLVGAGAWFGRSSLGAGLTVTVTRPVCEGPPATEAWYWILNWRCVAAEAGAT